MQARKLQFIIQPWGKVIWTFFQTFRELIRIQSENNAEHWHKYTSKKSEYVRDSECFWEVLFSFSSSYFSFLFVAVIFTSFQTSSQQTLSGLAGVKRESVLAIQVYIESRWLKLFLEWFMSAQTLRGQSKHKATLSNLLHPMLWHSYPNGSALLRMTMNRTLTQLFAQPFIWCKTYARGCPSHQIFISLQHLIGQKGHFPPSSTKHTKKRMEFLTEERRGIPLNKSTESQKVEACAWEKRNKARFWQLLVIQHSIKKHCFCFLPLVGVLKRFPTGAWFYPTNHMGK